MSETNANVLIVEDDAATQQLLTALMRRNGFTSVIAENGGRAIDVLQSRDDFDTVVLDIMMPSVDGRAVIDFLATSGRKVPVIVCTAVSPRLLDDLNRDVVFAVVTKPFDIDHLTSLIRELKTRRSSDKARFTSS
jgi:CheY-like chemotaxis protein